MKNEYDMDVDEHNYSVISASISPNERVDTETDQLDKIICQFLKKQRVPGATLAVARHGRIVYQQAYGVAGAGRRMKAATRLRLASISKPITAMAVLRLCQDGRLSLSDKVFGARGILKQLKTRGDKRLSKVTVRHLLQHSAGWDRDKVGDAVFWKVAPPAGVKATSPQYNAYLLQHVLKRKLQFTPGSRHAYSNLGYLALGEVIEAVTGQSYQEYAASLLSHIGVTSMYVGDERRADWQSQEAEYFNIKEPATAASVLPGQEGSSVLPQYGSFLMQNTGAFGGWVGTAADVLAILCSLEKSSREEGTNPRHALLSDDSIRAMLARPSFQHNAGGQEDWYGLGLDVQDGGSTWGHTGAMEGTCGTTQRHGSGTTWVFLLNAWAADMDLDGAVKLALSSVPRFSPFPCGVVEKTRGQVLTVTTRDRTHRVTARLPGCRLLPEICEVGKLGFGLLWVGVNAAGVTRKKDLTFNAIFSKDFGGGSEKEKRVLFDIDVNQLRTALEKQRLDGFSPEFISTYTADDVILSLCVLSPVQLKSEFEQEVDIAVPAQRYVQLLSKRKKKGFRVCTQSVIQWESELLVTAVMVRDVGTESEAEDSCPEKMETDHSTQNKPASSPKKITLKHTYCIKHSSSDNSKTQLKSTPCDKYSVSDRSVQSLSEKARTSHAEEQDNAKTKLKSRSYVKQPLPNKAKTFNAEEENKATAKLKSRAWDKHSSSDKVNPFHLTIKEEEDTTKHSPIAGAQTKTKARSWDNPSLSVKAETKTKRILSDKAKTKLESTSSDNPSSPDKVQTRRTPSDRAKTKMESTSSNNPSSPDKAQTKRTKSDKAEMKLESTSSDNPSSPDKAQTKRTKSDKAEMKLESTSSDNPSPPDKARTRLTLSDKAQTRRTLSWVQMPVDSLVPELGRQARHASGLTDVHFYPTTHGGGDWFVSAVWSPLLNRNCYQRLGVSRWGLLPALAEAAANDVKLRFLCQYEEEGEGYYALFWDAPL